MADHNSFFPHNILIKSYDSLRVPHTLEKKTMVEAINKVRSRKDLFYVDLGDYTDLMHGHVLYKFKKEGDTLKKGERLSEVNPKSPFWNRVEKVAILFHSQEYSHLRNKEGYHGKFGELDPLDRNLLYLLKDSKYGKAGSLIDANIVDKFAIKNNERRKTVRASHISESAFNTSFENMGVSVYFFKIKCNSQIDIEKSNVFEVEEDGEKICLAFQSFHCRRKSCRGSEVVEHETRY
jgi:hypothetical protein